MRTDYEQIAASVERLGEERDLLRTELSDTKVERDEARAEAKALKSERDHQRARAEAIEGAARALLSSMHDVHVCHACRAIATRRLWNEPGMSWFGCDEHGATHSEDLPHAPAIRTLRTLLEGKL